MKNPLGEKKTFLLMAGILSFLAYLWGLVSNFASDISPLTIIYSFLIFICCSYYTFKKPSAEPYKAITIIVIFAMLIGSFTYLECSYKLLIVPLIALSIYGIISRLKGTVEKVLGWHIPTSSEAYSFYKVAFPVLTISGLILLALTAILTIQTNTVYTFFATLLMAFNLICFSIMLIGSLLTLTFNSELRTVYSSTYVAIFSLYGILVSSHYFYTV